MAMLTERRVREAARERLNRSGKTSTGLLTEIMARGAAGDRFDVFLSHAVRDAELVVGTVAVLEAAGLKVYVDWIVDPHLDRERVTPATAQRLRGRMLQCDTLLYLHTESAPQSKWMPWELGFADGRHGRVAILPVLRGEGSEFSGQEYLGIYPYFDISTRTLRTGGAVQRSMPLHEWKVAARPGLYPQ